jgi:hypothetical protein
MERRLGAWIGLLESYQASKDFSNASAAAEELLLMDPRNKCQLGKRANLSAVMSQIVPLAVPSRTHEATIHMQEIAC